MEDGTISSFTGWPILGPSLLGRTASYIFCAPEKGPAVCGEIYLTLPYVPRSPQMTVDDQNSVLHLFSAHWRSGGSMGVSVPITTPCSLDISHIA